MIGEPGEILHSDVMVSVCILISFNLAYVSVRSFNFVYFQHYFYVLKR